jgi:hypothetical protein
MFWSKATTQTEDFQVLFKKFENLRIEVEGIKLDLALYKQKLSKKAGISFKRDDEDETETNKNPTVLLNPNGNPIIATKLRNEKC